LAIEAHPMHKHLFTFVILAILPYILKAQYSIEGSLTDSSGTRIPYVQIFLFDLNRAVLSDSTGHFIIDKLPNGNFNIDFKHIGYDNTIKNVTVNGNLELNFILKKKQHEMQEIVISNNNQNLKDKTALNIDLITSEQIEEKGCISLTDALTAMPGVSTVSTGPGVGRPVIRGLSGNRIVTVVNGVKLENHQWDSEHALGLSQFGFDHVEVIKGPASFLYGPEAMGGVLNFVDEKQALENTMTGDAFIGQHTNTVGTIASLGLKGAGKKAYFNFRGGINNHSDYYTGNSYDRVANSRFREGMSKALIGYNTLKSSSTITYQFNGGAYGIVEPFEKQGIDTEAHPMEFETPYHLNFHHTIAMRNNLILGNSKLKSIVAYQHDERQELEPGNLSNAPYLGFLLHSGYFNLQWEKSMTHSFSVIIGSQGNIQKNTNFGYGRVIPDYNQSDLGFFTLSRFNFNKWIVEGAIRYDLRKLQTLEQGIAGFENYSQAIKKYYDNWSGSIGTSYHLTENHTFKLNIANGFRAPNTMELTSNGFHLETQRYEIGTGIFQKEQNFQIDLSDRIERKNTTFDGSIFYNSILNYIYLAPTKTVLNDNVVYVYTQENAILKGGELSIAFHGGTSKKINLLTAASYVTGKNNLGFLPMIPPFRIKNELSIGFEKFKYIKNPFISLSSLLVFRQKQPFLDEAETPAYIILNCNLGGEFDLKGYPIEITLGANNLLNQNYLDHLSRLRRYTVYSMGIDVFLNLKMHFNALSKK
jgi:iron complex outermembrane receptor protein